MNSINVGTSKVSTGYKGSQNSATYQFIFDGVVYEYIIQW